MDGKRMQGNVLSTTQTLFWGLSNKRQAHAGGGGILGNRISCLKNPPRGGYITPAAWGIPTASEQGAESEVAAVRSGKSYLWGAAQQSVDFRVGGQHQKWLNWGEGRNFGCAVQKNTTKNIFAEMVCLRRKTPLKPPHRPVLKKGGVSKPPTLSDFSEPPSPGPMWAELQRHHSLLHGEDAYLADFTKDARNGHAVQRHSHCDQELGVLICIILLRTRGDCAVIKCVGPIHSRYYNWNPNQNQDEEVDGG